MGRFSEAFKLFQEETRFPFELNGLSEISERFLHFTDEKAELRRHSVTVPKDLISLWARTSGQVPGFDSSGFSATLLRAIWVLLCSPCHLCKISLRERRSLCFLDFVSQGNLWAPSSQQDQDDALHVCVTLFLRNYNTGRRKLQSISS